MTNDFSQNKLLSEKIEQAHNEIWKRFINKPYGILLNHTDLDGNVLLPTPEECRLGKPNALSWDISITDGAFFSGLYLDGLCNRWQIRKEEETKKEAEEIANGLILLSKVGNTPGFIARNVTTDGKSHYPLGSDDQTAPWFYGLWKYIKSGIPEDSEKKKIIKLMEDVAIAIEKLGWRMPCDQPQFEARGDISGADFRAVSRLLFMLRAIYELTGNSVWLEKYRQKLNENAGNSGKTRLEICAQGLLSDKESSLNELSNAIWIVVGSQAALRELFLMEEDEKIRSKFLDGLRANAQHVLPLMSKYRKFDHNSPLKFNINWKKLNDMWFEQKNVNDAVRLAVANLKELESSISPRLFRLESPYMREPLCIAWTIALSEARDLINKALPEIKNVLTYYDWSKLYSSAFFVAECVYYEVLNK